MADDPYQGVKRKSSHLDSSATDFIQYRMQESLARVAQMASMPEVSAMSQPSSATSSMVNFLQQDPSMQQPQVQPMWPTMDFMMPSNAVSPEQAEGSVREIKREKRQQINQSIMAAIAAGGGPLANADPMQSGHAGGADPEQAQKAMQAYIAAAASAAGQAWGASMALAGSVSSGSKKKKKSENSQNLPLAWKKKMEQQGGGSTGEGTSMEAQQVQQLQMQAAMMAQMAGMQGMPMTGVAGMDPMSQMGAQMGAAFGMSQMQANPMMAALSAQGGSQEKYLEALHSMGFCLGGSATDSVEALEAGANAVRSLLPPELSDKAKARLAMQYASISAQQVQLARQSQFHSQMRSWENQKLASSSGGNVEVPETRFENGYRPTQLCKKFFLYEGCVHGNKCTFAHAYEELHPASAELIDLPRSDMLSEQKVEDFETQEPHMRMKKKREMCQRFQNKGECLLGKRCMFAHTESDLGKVELVYDDRVKTEICRKWETGKCVFGRYCPHAHGMDQIGRLKPPEEICRMSAPIRPKDKKDH